MCKEPTLLILPDREMPHQHSFYASLNIQHTANVTFSLIVHLLVVKSELRKR